MTGAVVVAALAALVVFIFLLLKRREGEKSSRPAAMEDAGAAIVAFGKAYPTLPIRQVILTADRHTAFLRLVDGRVGCAEAAGNHVFARVLAPDRLLLEPKDDPRVFDLHARDGHFAGGTFAFASEADAAEVSLWLTEALAAQHADTHTGT